MKEKPPEEKTEKRRAVWEAYNRLFSERYGVEPLRGKSVNIQIARIGDELPASDIEGTLRAYFGDQSPWLVAQKHPVGVLVKQVNAHYARFKANEKRIDTVAEMGEELLTHDDRLTIRGMPEEMREQATATLIGKRREQQREAIR
jgi:hypothetical protein